MPYPNFPSVDADVLAKVEVRLRVTGNGIINQIPHALFFRYPDDLPDDFDGRVFTAFQDEILRLDHYLFMTVRGRDPRNPVREYEPEVGFGLVHTTDWRDLVSLLRP